MVRRYPHRAELIVKAQELIQDERGNIIESERRHWIKGRFEPIASSDHLNYSAKFYAPLNDIAPFTIDGADLLYERKRFSVTQLFNYQRHCELWLS